MSRMALYLGGNFPLGGRKPVRKRPLNFRRTANYRQKSASRRRTPLPPKVGKPTAHAPTAENPASRRRAPCTGQPAYGARPYRPTRLRRAPVPAAHAVRPTSSATKAAVPRKILRVYYANDMARFLCYKALACHCDAFMSNRRHTDFLGAAEPLLHVIDNLPKCLAYPLLYCQHRVSERPMSRPGECWRRRR
jgi:hypothetical protein